MVRLSALADGHARRIVSPREAYPASLSASASVAAGTTRVRRISSARSSSSDLPPEITSSAARRIDSTRRDSASRPLLLRDRVAQQPATLGARLGDGHLGLAARLLLHVVGGALGRDERRAQERLELDVARDLGLQGVHALAELGALAPDGLEAVRDLLDLAGGRPTAGSRRGPRRSVGASLPRVSGTSCASFVRAVAR